MRVNRRDFLGLVSRPTGRGYVETSGKSRVEDPQPGFSRRGFIGSALAVPLLGAACGDTGSYTGPNGAKSLTAINPGDTLSIKFAGETLKVNAGDFAQSMKVLDSMTNILRDNAGTKQMSATEKARHQGILADAVGEGPEILDEMIVMTLLASSYSSAQARLGDEELKTRLVNEGMDPRQVDAATRALGSLGSNFNGFVRSIESSGGFSDENAAATALNLSRGSWSSSLNTGDKEYLIRFTKLVAALDKADPNGGVGNTIGTYANRIQDKIESRYGFKLPDYVAVSDSQSARLTQRSGSLASDVLIRMNNDGPESYSFEKADGTIVTLADIRNSLG